MASQKFPKPESEDRHFSRCVLNGPELIACQARQLCLHPLPTPPMIGGTPLVGGLRTDAVASCPAT